MVASTAYDVAGKILKPIKPKAMLEGPNLANTNNDDNRVLANPPQTIVIFASGNRTRTGITVLKVEARRADRVLPGEFGRHSAAPLRVGCGLYGETRQ